MSSGVAGDNRPAWWSSLRHPLAQPFRVEATHMWLVGEDDRTWPVPTCRVPGEHADGVRVVRRPATVTAVERLRR